MKKLVLFGLLILLLSSGWWNFASQVSAESTSEPQSTLDLLPELVGALPAEAEEDHLFQCWLGEGITLARSASLAGKSLARFDAAVGEPRFANIILPNGESARAVSVRFLPPSAPESDPGRPTIAGANAPPGITAGMHPVEVVVARKHDDLAGLLAQFRWLLVGSWLATSLFSALALSWAVRRGLAPLDQLGNQIQAKDETHLATPFALPGAPQELAPVVNRLNGFVERLANVIEREHTFAAHAAHELRTPLAGLRSTLEVSLSRPREPSEYEECERASLGMTVQLERLVERLMELARTASPNAIIRPEPIQLLPLIQECWLPFSDAAAERGVRLETDVPASFGLIADRQLLRRLLLNLLENASNYTDADECIRLVVRSSPGQVELQCANPCAGISPEVAGHAMDAFWRSDSARTATGKHSGLGLALCRQIAELLNGEIQISASDGRFMALVKLNSGSLTELSLDSD
ncbi:MAG: two-component system heavy metal sensor histidine kinase CusS [Planctomycetota bacterium]|jgi:two-component system heavy metal sensor histidine kinase CusS